MIIPSTTSIVPQKLKPCFLHDRKTILQDIVKYSDFTTDKFQEIHRRMQKAVDSVKPVEEYRDFIGKHRYSFQTYFYHYSLM